MNIILVKNILILVNHSHFFKDPNTGVHTNTIEGSWMHAKKFVRGVTKKKKASYFAEFMFRNEFKKFDLFLKALEIINN